MKTAILMSTYNGASYLAEQIESILAQQSESEIDLIVRDDGSTDETISILQSYASAGKLRYYTGENLKPAKSFLDLIVNCTGYDYYALADQDDNWYPDKVQSCIARLEGKTKPAMAFANAALVDGALQMLGRNVYKNQPNCDFYSVLCGGGILGCTVAFNEPLAQLVRQYAKPQKLIMHDSYLAILCTLFDGEISYDPTPHMAYRQHGNNVVGAQWSKWAALKNRLARITQKQKVSIAEMAQSILDQNPVVPDAKKLAFLKKVAAYRKSFFTAVGLACSGKPRYNSRNMAVTMRLAMLLRNR